MGVRANCRPRARRGTGALTAAADHATTIRTACATLVLLPPDVLPAASVTGRLVGGPAEARRLTALSHEVAERAGLVADVRVDGPLFHVRLHRAPSAPTARRSVGWVARMLGGWLGPP